jgi:hypothetical protein
MEEAGEAASYYEQVASIVSRCSSLDEIERRLGGAVSGHLYAGWGINVMPAVREYEGLRPNLSPSEIQADILGPIERIASTYRSIEDGLQAGGFNYECEYRDSWWYERCGEGTEAWVLKNVPSDIHLCVDEFDPDNIEELASTIVHEASHKFGGVLDGGNPIENAHSYDDIVTIPSLDDRPWVREMEDAFGVDVDVDGLEDVDVDGLEDVEPPLPQETADPDIDMDPGELGDELGEGEPAEGEDWECEEFDDLQGSDVDVTGECYEPEDVLDDVEPDSNEVDSDIDEVESPR